MFEYRMIEYGMIETKQAPLSSDEFAQLGSMNKKAYLTEPMLAKHLFQQIKNNEISLFTNLIQDKSIYTLEELPQFLKTVVPNLITSLIGSMCLVSDLFTNLSDEYCTIFCQHLNDQIINLFIGEEPSSYSLDASTYILACSLNSLSLSQLSIFCKLVGIDRIMNDSLLFCKVMENLKPEARLVVEEIMYPNLKDYHLSGYAYQLTFRWLSSPTRARLYFEVCDQMPDLIYNEDSFNNSLEYLTRKQRKRIFKAVFSQLVNFWVAEPLFAARIFTYLTPNQCIELIEAVEAVEPGFVSGTVLSYILYSLTSLAQLKAVLGYFMQGEKPRFISLFQEQRADLFDIFDSRSSKSWLLELCKLTKDVFLQIIPTFELFSEGFKRITRDEQYKRSSIICAGYLEQLSVLTNSASEFIYLTKLLSSKPLVKFCQLMQPKFAQMLPSLTDWEEVLKSLPIKKARTVVYEAMIANCLEMIFSPSFSRLFPYFSPKQQEEVSCLVLLVQQWKEKSDLALVTDIQQGDRVTLQDKVSHFLGGRRQHSLFTDKLTKEYKGQPMAKTSLAAFDAAVKIDAFLDSGP